MLPSQGIRPGSRRSRYFQRIVVVVMIVMPGFRMVLVPLIRERFRAAELHDKIFHVLMVVMVLFDPIGLVLNALELDILRHVVRFLAVGKLLLGKILALLKLLELTRLVGCC